MFNSYVSLPEGTSTIDKDCILYGHDCGIDSQQWHEPSTGVVWKRICFDNGFPPKLWYGKRWWNQRMTKPKMVDLHGYIPQFSKPANHGKKWWIFFGKFWCTSIFPQKKRKAFWDLDQISRFPNRGYPTNLDLEIWLDLQVNISNHTIYPLVNYD